MLPCIRVLANRNGEVLEGGVQDFRRGHHHLLGVDAMPVGLMRRDNALGCK